MPCIELHLLCTPVRQYVNELCFTVGEPVQVLPYIADPAVVRSCTALDLGLKAMQYVVKSRVPKPVL